MVLIDACAGLVRGIGVEPDAWRELTWRYLSDPHPAQLQAKTSTPIAAVGEMGMP